MSTCSQSYGSCCSTEAQMCKGDLTLMVISTINYLLMILFTGYIGYIAYTYEPDLLFASHPFLMTLGFFCFTTNAIFCANSNNILLWRVSCRKRYRIYWVMQALAYILITIGFVLVIISTSQDDKRGHFTTLHGVVGLLLFIQMTIRVIVLLISGLKGQTRAACCTGPNFKTLSTVLAITTYAHGLVQLMLGVLTLWFRRLNSDYTVAICIAVLIILSLCAIWKPLSRLRNRVAPGVCTAGCPG